MKVQKTTDYKSILMDCYSDDEYFLRNYVRNAPTTLENCVNLGLEDFAKAIDFTMYAIYVDGKLAAYFGKELMAKKSDYLHGFFIKKEFRTKEFITKFWKVWKSKFKSQVFCGLYKFNYPAIKFLKKRGFKDYSELQANGFDIVVLKVN